MLFPVVGNKFFGKDKGWNQSPKGSLKNSMFYTVARLLQLISESALIVVNSFNLQ